MILKVTWIRALLGDDGSKSSSYFMKNESKHSFSECWSMKSTKNSTDLSLMPKIVISESKSSLVSSVSAMAIHARRYGRLTSAATQSTHKK